jgi:hypothetical protein
MAIDFPSSPTNGQTYTSGGTTWVYDSAVPAWNLQNTVISGPTGPTGPTGPGITFTGYDNEIHVSAADGSDSTGDGSLLNPVATITHAITLVSGSRNTIIVHTGTYAESPTLSALTYIKAEAGPTQSVGPFINGTLTIPTGATNSQVVGLTIATLTTSGTAAANILNCNITSALNKTSTGTVVISGGTITNFSATAAGLTRINDVLQVSSPINNHASSTVAVVNCKVVLNPVNTLGNMFLSNSTVFGTGTYGLTSAAGSVQVTNSTIFNSTGSATLPISITGGFYLINNASLNYASSVFTGATDLGSTFFSSRINAISFITRGGSSSQYVKGDGSLESLTPVTKTADFTVATTESYLINDKSGSACVVTLPAAASFAGRKLVFTNYQAQAIDSDSSNVVPVGGGSAGTAIVGATAGAWATLVSDGTNWLIVQEG